MFYRQIYFAFSCNYELLRTGLLRSNMYYVLSRTAPAQLCYELLRWRLLRWRLNKSMISTVSTYTYLNKSVISCLTGNDRLV